MTGIQMGMFFTTTDVDDVIPDPLDWPNLSGGSIAPGANDQVTGISSNIDFSWAISGFTGTNVGSGTVQVQINGGSFITIWSDSAGINTSPTSVANGANVSFFSSLSADNPSNAASMDGTITVRNQSDSNTTLDTFTFSNFISGF